MASGAGMERPQDVADALAEGARKDQIAAQNRQLRVRAMTLGHSVGLPVDAALYIINLEARIANLEKTVVALEGPPHLHAVEKR